MAIEIVLGDVMDVLRDIPDETFTACFSDPPYGINFMNAKWDHGVPSKAVWAEVLRVLKPGAALMAFGGTRTWHRLAVAIEDAGFEIFDMCMWVHAQGFPKSHAIGKAIDKAAGAERRVIGHNPNARPNSDVRGQLDPQGIYGGGKGTDHNPLLTAPTTDAARIWEGYGTALKPAIEPIVLARRPRRGTYVATAIEHGTAALNIDGCRVAGGRGQGVWGSSNQDCQEGRVFNASPDGVDYRSQRHTQGRWPSNLVVSHAPGCEVIGERQIKPLEGYRPNPVSKQADGQIQFNKKLPGFQKVSYTDAAGLETVEAWKCADGCPVAALERQKAGASRFFQTLPGEPLLYFPKAGVAEKEKGLESLAPKQVDVGRDPDLPGGHNPRNRGAGKRRCHHPTVKPLALCEYLARLIVPPMEYRDEAQLLIPFAGVASEIIGATKAGWRNILGIEIVPEYVEIASLRIAAHTAELAMQLEL